MPHDLNVVLVEPQIPPNTGSVGRLCVGTRSRLHLVEPLGFDIDEKSVRRAGLDYWKFVDLVVHPSLDAFLASIPADAPVVFIEKEGPRTIFQHEYKCGSYLIFGKETTGIPDEVIARNLDKTLRIPMYDDRIRSFNLSNSVSIVVFEAIRQLGP